MKPNIAIITTLMLSRRDPWHCTDWIGARKETRPWREDAHNID